MAVPRKGRREKEEKKNSVPLTLSNSPVESHPVPLPALTVMLQ